MTEIRKYEAKSADTRFKPGNRGKPKGARHRSTVLAERLMADDVEDIVKAVVRAAKTGAMSAARIVLDRLAPVRRGRPVQFDLPVGTDAAGISAAFDAVLYAVAQGTLTPEEGGRHRELVGSPPQGHRDSRTGCTAHGPGEERGAVKAGFVRRLERLEATASSRREPPSISQPQRLLRMLLACHRGAWQEHEALFAGWGRALGYELTSVLLQDLKTNPAAIAARHNEVLSEFLAAHGLCLDVSTWADAFPTVADLFEQIPEALRLRFGLRSIADAFPSG